MSITLLAQCSTPTEKKSIATNTIKTQVNAVMDNWHAAASKANYEEYFGAMDTVSVFIGTDAGENWDKNEFQNFSKPFFDQGKAWDFKVLERNTFISSSGDVVWFDELLDTWMGTCRGSGVLEKTETSWTIKHYVLSMTIPNDDVQKVIAVTKEKDSLFRASFLK